VGTSIRAAVVERSGALPDIQDVELAPVAGDEVLVRLAATGVCHTDVGWAAGEYDALEGAFPFPVILGHESAGVVEQVGGDVQRVRPGDRVVLTLAHHCGHCGYCARGTPMLCEQRVRNRTRHTRGGEPVVQGHGVGGFAEATVVREVSAIKIPDGVPMEVAALLGCAVATGVGAAVNIAQVRPGSTVAVLGAGGVGVSVVMGAKLAGAARIAVLEPNAARRGRATAFGATDVLGSDEPCAVALEPDGFDYVFESAGRTDAMEMAVRLARRGGTVTLIGAPRPDASIAIPALDFVASQKRLLGCLTGNVHPDIDIDAYCRLYLAGALPLDELVSARIGFDDVREGFRRTGEGEGLRTVVVFP
jgi:S-(hydroxymethyl)glutathione dehydrogenase/alcohol dehydrogenase